VEVFDIELLDCYPAHKAGNGAPAARRTSITENETMNDPPDTFKLDYLPELVDRMGRKIKKGFRDIRFPSN
jgi:hypothetical protein